MKVGTSIARSSPLIVPNLSFLQDRLENAVRFVDSRRSERVPEAYKFTFGEDYGDTKNDKEVHEEGLKKIDYQSWP
jgi:hypothetical protein